MLYYFSPKQTSINVTALSWVLVFWKKSMKIQNLIIQKHYISKYITSIIHGIHCLKKWIPTLSFPIFPVFGSNNRTFLCIRLFFFCIYVHMFIWGIDYIYIMYLTSYFIHIFSYQQIILVICFIINNCLLRYPSLNIAWLNSSLFIASDAAIKNKLLFLFTIINNKAILSCSCIYIELFSSRSSRSKTAEAKVMHILYLIVTAKLAFKNICSYQYCMSVLISPNFPAVVIIIILFFANLIVASIFIFLFLVKLSSTSYV